MADPDLGENVADHGPKGISRFGDRILGSRRAVTALFSITCLTWLGTANKTDVSMAIAAIASAMCAGNAFEKKGKGSPP